MHRLDLESRKGQDSREDKKSWPVLSDSMSSLTRGFVSEKETASTLLGIETASCWELRMQFGYETLDKNIENRAWQRLIVRPIQSSTLPCIMSTMFKLSKYGTSNRISGG